MDSASVHTADDIVEDGQFDDAPDDPTAPVTVDPRQGHNFIDDDALLEWSSDSSEDEGSEPDEFEQEEDLIEAEAFQTLRAEDEDWEIAERGTPLPDCTPSSPDEPPTQTSRNSTIGSGSTSPCARARRRVLVRH